jgi:prepilin-type N-terminal cleavage/methylation domain-containing protein
MEMKPGPRGEKGFSLVEITVALVVGSIGLLALAGIIVYTTNANRYATDISIATALARQKIEQIKLTEYNYVEGGTEYSLDQNGNQITSGRYTRVTEVLDDQPLVNTKTVNVTVYFSPTMEDTLKKALVSTIIYP